MTATDELRRMLDERGVKWDELVGHPVVVGTEWYDSDGCPCTALEHADDVPDGMLSVQANLTPEQAIEATLGCGTCEMEYVSDFMSWHCKACGQMDMAPRNPKPRYCKWCGAKVVDNASVD